MLYIFIAIAIIGIAIIAITYACIRESSKQTRLELKRDMDAYIAGHILMKGVKKDGL